MTGLVVALWSEARPLIDRFELRPETATAGPYRVYRGDEVSVIVSGVGKIAAAAATSYLFAATGSVRDRPWINFGIAGHGSRPIGEGILASKVEDRSSGRVWYPCPLFESPAALCPVSTVDRVEERYAGDVAYEMEAAGFFATAVRFSLAELVQVYKVISDGPRTDKDSLSAARIGELVTAHLEPLEWIVRGTARLAGELAAAEPGVELEPWLERWRFTVSQRRRLRSLLGRLEVFRPGTVDPEHAALARNASEVLTKLETSLQRVSLDDLEERPR